MPNMHMMDDPREPNVIPALGKTQAWDAQAGWIQYISDEGD